MKSRSQSGSAHTVIIIVLVVALLATLGFVFWQNFINKPQETTETTSSTTTSESTTVEEEDSTMTALVIGNYGVEVPYDSTTDTYTLKDRSAGGYTVYSKKVTDACGDQVNIGAINRYTKGDSIPSPNNYVTIGAYDYALLIGGYGSCSSDTGLDVLTSVTDAFGKAFEKLKTVE